MELSEEEKRKLEAFIYWVETNTVSRLYYRKIK